MATRLRTRNAVRRQNFRGFTSALAETAKACRKASEGASVLRQFEAAWAAEIAADRLPDEVCDKLHRRTKALAETILRERPRDLAGVKRKMRVLAWCYGGAVRDGLSVLREMAPTTDVKAAHAILRDLFAIA